MTEKGKGAGNIRVNSDWTFFHQREIKVSFPDDVHHELEP